MFSTAGQNGMLPVWDASIPKKNETRRKHTNLVHVKILHILAIGSQHFMHKRSLIKRVIHLNIQLRKFIMNPLTTVARRLWGRVVNKPFTTGASCSSVHALKD